MLNYTVHSAEPLVLPTQNPEQPDRDLFFIDDLCMRSEQGQQAVRRVVEALLEYERETCARSRRRRTDDQMRLERTVEAITCNVLRASLLGPSKAIAIPRSKRALWAKTRYNPWYFGKQMPRALDNMEQCRLLDQEKGFRNPFDGPHVRTTIQMGPRLADLCSMLSLRDIGQSSEGETIILKNDDKQWIEYVDDGQIIRWREEMRHINEMILSANIEYNEEDPHADVTRRKLVRHFLRGSFDLYGRMHGGFWIDLSKAQRRDHLMIEGEPVISLDYGQSSLRIAYGLAGAEPPSGDLYAIPGLEPYREGVKKLINAMLNTPGRLQRKPMGTAWMLPYSLDIQTLQGMIIAHHQPIAHFFGTDQGLRLNFHESEVIIQVILRLCDQGVVSLPVHDCILVKETDADVATEVMENIFREMIGVEPLVKQEW